MSTGSSNTASGSTDDETDSAAYLLRDDTADINEDDNFGHYQYVQTLSETIQEVDPPWHIGLFGRWGTGKSSILEAIEDDLPTPADSEDDASATDRIEYIEFDAWKHAEDSIRTEFLLRIDEALARNDDDDGLGESAITETLLDVSVAEEGDYPDTPAIFEDNEQVWHRLYDAGAELRDKWVLGVPILILGLLIVLQHGGFLPQWVPVDGAYGATLFTALGLPLFIYLLREVAGNRETYQRQMYPRKDWSGAYETLFEDILDEHEETYGRPDRYVIAVDNLDRCEPETVYDVLISMKTFFEDDKERCLYIVPCDDETLRQHVADVSPEKRNGTDAFNDSFMSDEEEFLRKFFQTTIQLPPFEVQNVESFANDQFDSLADTRQPGDREGVLDVLTEASVRTPRRIKHTINRFLTLQTLAEKLERDRQLKVHAISESEAFLMKTLVLKEDFPDIYEQIRQDPDRLTELHELAISQEFDDDPDGRLADNTTQMASDGGSRVATADTEPASDAYSQATQAWDARRILHSTPALRQFLRQTQAYTEKPRPFVFLNDAELVELYGQYAEFQAAIEDGDIGTAREELETLPENLKPADTRELVHDIVTRSLEETDAATHQSILSTLFAVPATADSPHTDGIVSALSEFLDTARIANEVESLEFHPEVTWRIVVAHERDQEGRPHTTALLNEATTADLAVQDSPQSQLLQAALQTIADEDTAYAAFVGDTLREKLRSLASQTDNPNLILAVGRLLEAQPAAARKTLSPPLYRALIDQIPTESDGGGVNYDALELTVALDDAVRSAPAVEETLTDLTDELVSTVLDAAIPSIAEIDTASLRRLQEIDYTALSRECGWKVHQRLSPLFGGPHTADTPQSLDDVSVLTTLWLHAVFQIGSLEPVDDNAPTVDETFTTLVETLQGSEFKTFIETFVDLASEDGPQLGLLNKHAVLETYLEFVLDHVTETALIGDSLALVESGELAPLEDHVEETFAENPKKQPPRAPAELERWAAIAVEAPEQFEGMRADLAYQCVIHLEKSPDPEWLAVLPYPASQHDRFKDQPAFQDRITRLIEHGLVSRSPGHQYASIAALKAFPPGSDSYDELIGEAGNTVKRAYLTETQPPRDLEDLVLAEADTETTDGIHHARLEYLQSASAGEDEQGQAKALSVITDHFEECYAAVGEDEMAALIEALESHDQRSRHPQFVEELDAIKAKRKANTNADT